MAEFKVFNDINKLIVWLLPILGKIPRNYRYTLAIRIENALYDITEYISEYELLKKKTSILQIDIKLKSISKYVRYARQIKLISDQQHYAFIQQVDAIGKQLGGWIKSLKD